ncbi:hypothetical protein SAMN05518871_101610 [Psychrobacillus sp. OK028]|nr:hypothetical protein [Psychrobacillus sp. OK028]SDM58893.1 hypothetical protein SAMN05518871_101610 [Psychrobacillus sp. OK028]
MSNKSKPNFKKKEPNSRNDNREEFAEEIDSNQTKSKTEKQNNRKNR